METKFGLFMVVLVVLAVGTTASAEPTKKLGWGLSLVENSINLYKLYYEYIEAILHDGIPALHVRPLDPMFVNVTLRFGQQSNPDYPKYTDLQLEINGFTVSEFSNYVINTAELDLEAMSANLSIYNEEFKYSSDNVVATANADNGRQLRYSCSNVVSTIKDGTYSAVKQLEVQGTLLHVKRFDQNYDTGSVELDISPDHCTGDAEIKDYVSDFLLGLVTDLIKTEYPEYLRNSSALITTVLNDIFALRNITDDSAEADVSTSAHQIHQLPTKFSKPAANEERGEVISRHTTRGSHQKLANKPKANRPTMEWSFLTN